MPDLSYVAPTKRRSTTKARAARIFLAANGRCCLCGQQIRPGDGWFIEHVNPLAQGGADDDSNTAPAHTKCKRDKDAVDAASKAKRDRIVTAGYAPGRPTLKARGFIKRPPQRSATRPIVRKSERTEV